MSIKNTKILAIDPGTRYMGIAFFDKDELIYHNVCVIEGKSSQDKLKEGKRIILRLIRDFRPNVVVVEKAFFENHKTASLLNVFVDEIKSIAKKRNLKLMSFAATTVRKFIGGNGNADKKALREVIVSRIPKLKVYLTQDRVWKERYHQNMFDAIGLGLMALSSMVNGK